MTVLYTPVIVHRPEHPGTPRGFHQMGKGLYETFEEAEEALTRRLKGYRGYGFIQEIDLNKEAPNVDCD